MPNFNRRDFIKHSAASLGASAALSALPPSIRKALAIPANNITGTLRDVEHVVILMKENRSFDHYFGTLGGIRGFNDKATLPTEGHASIFQQGDGNGGYIEPFRADSDTTNALNMGGLPHGWPDGHAMWDGGRWDDWVPAKGPNTMAYFTREDIPFHYALADSFTVCDQYFCSVMGPTNPNRVHLYTGMLDVQASGHGPLLANAPADGALTWTIYIQRLQEAGVSWRVYQGSDGTEPFRTALTPTVLGDLDFPNPYNTMNGFQQIIDAPAGSPLAAVSAKRTYAQLVADVQANQLAQVSWLMPAAWCSEHPVYTPADGATYTAAILDALTSNPEVWSKTVLFVMYDENDGFFDHVVAPTPPASGGGISNIDTSNELFVSSPYWPGYAAGPVGLGGRVPMLVISPWSKGAWTCSEVFDHTSVIRFLEARFGVNEPNITTWRRAICGDLTSAFDFRHPNNKPISVPSTAGLTAKAAATAGFPSVQPPAVQAMPLQESGVRNLRASPYELFVDATQGASGIQLTFVNTGNTAVVFHVYSAIAPTSVKDYTVAVNTQLMDTWTLTSVAGNGATHDLTVTGPNGFLRRFSGSRTGAGLEVTACYEVTQGDIYLNFVNSGSAPCAFTVTDNSYGQPSQIFEVAPGSTLRRGLSLSTSHGWYDLTVTCNTDPSFIRRFAGHVETGFPSMSDPTLSTGAVTGIDTSGNIGSALLSQEGPGCKIRCSASDQSFGVR